MVKSMKTGIREPIVFEGPRELDTLIEFIKEKGALNVDGAELKAKLDEQKLLKKMKKWKKKRKKKKKKLQLKTKKMLNTMNCS